jgi:hypothetical protein
MNLRGKKVLFFSIVVAVVSILLYLSFLFFQHGKIVLVLPEGQKTITIASDDNKYVHTVTSSEVYFEKYLRSSNYNLTVQTEKNSGTFFKVVDISGRLSVNNVDVVLVQESGRSFIGDNPRSCSEIIKETLLTYVCNGPLSSMVMHVPATNSLPTYTKSLQSQLERKVTDTDTPNIGSVQAIINNNNELLVLTHKIEFGQGFHNVYSIGLSNNSFVFKFMYSVDSLIASKKYRSTIDNGSVVLYSDDYSSFYRGKTFNDLVAFNPISSVIDGNKMTSFDYVNGKILASYTTQPLDYKNITQESTDTRLVFNEGEKEVTKILPFFSTKVEICGLSICAVDTNNTLRIYDLGLNMITSFTDVKDFTSVGSNLYIAVNNQLLTLNTENLEGNIAVDFGGYSFGGMSKSNSGIILTLDSGNKQHALQISDKFKGQYFDKLVLPFFDSSEIYINSASIYGSKLFVSPELGERVYNSTTGTYKYSETIKEQARKNIEALIDVTDIQKSGIDVFVNILN